MKNGIALSYCSVVPYNKELLIGYNENYYVVFSQNECLPSILKRSGLNKTMMTRWFDQNKNNVEANQLYYSQFPNKYVEDAWKKNGFADQEAFLLNI